MAQTEASDRRNPTTTPDVNDLLDALNDPDRRVVLHAVHETGRPVGVDELVARVVAFQCRTLPDADVPVQAIRTRLHHVHLPKLGAAGLLDYDARREVVTAAGTADVTGPVTAMNRLADFLDV